MRMSFLPLKGILTPGEQPHIQSKTVSGIILSRITDLGKLRREKAIITALY